MSFTCSYLKNLFLVSSTFLATTTYASDLTDGDSLSTSPKSLSAGVPQVSTSPKPEDGRKFHRAALSPTMVTLDRKGRSREQKDAFKSPPRMRPSEGTDGVSVGKGIEHLLSPRLLPSSEKKGPRSAFVKTSSLRTVPESLAAHASKRSAQASSHEDMRSLTALGTPHLSGAEQRMDESGEQSKLDAVTGAIDVLQSLNPYKNPNSLLKTPQSSPTLTVSLQDDSLPPYDESDDEIESDALSSPSTGQHVRWGESSMVPDQTPRHIKRLDLTAIGLFCRSDQEMIELSQHVRAAFNPGVASLTPGVLAQGSEREAFSSQGGIPSVPFVPRIPLDQLSKLHKPPVVMTPTSSASPSSSSSERVSPVSPIKSLSAEHVSFLVAMETFDRQKNFFLADLEQQKTNNVILRSLSGRPTDKAYRKFRELNFGQYFSEAELGLSASVARDSRTILLTLLYVAEDFEQAVTWYGTMDKGRLSDNGICETAKMLGNVCRFFDTHRLMLVHLYTSVWSVAPRRVLTDPDFKAERMEKGQATYLTGLRKLLTVVKDFQECLKLRQEQMEAARSASKGSTETSEPAPEKVTSSSDSDKKLPKAKKGSTTPRSHDTQTVTSEQSEGASPAKEKRASKEKRKSAEKLARQNSKTTMPPSTATLELQDASASVALEPDKPNDRVAPKKKGIGHKFRHAMGL
ncbi:MAG: hypothetical protein ACK5TR_02040 [Alphaproteobacteria bacterium]|jgi:hypothetical protein|nr:hypothetical protein [Alphaproteobacteria bacterium]